MKKFFKFCVIIFSFFFILTALFFQGNSALAQTPIARKYFTFYNLVRNGSFESFDQTQGIPAEWTITDTSKVSLLSDPLQVKVGAVSLNLSEPVKFTQEIRDWKGLEASNVTLGAWIKGSSGDSLKFYVDDGVNRQEKAVSLTDAQWKFVTFKPATAINSSAQYLKVELEIVSTASGISLDGVMLSQVTKGVAFVPNPDDQEKSPLNLIYTDTVNGNVGIGTSQPQKTLDVAGDIRASGKVYQGESEQQEELLTKTAADDLYLNNDQDETITKNLTVNGLLTSGAGKILNDLEVAGLVKAERFEGDGSGLTNILEHWKSSADGTGIYFNQGNVGIGTVDPKTSLDVANGYGWFHAPGGRSQTNIALGEFTDNPAAFLYTIMTDDDEDSMKFLSGRYQGSWQFNRNDEKGEMNAMFLSSRPLFGTRLELYGNDGDAGILVHANDAVNDRHAFLELRSGNADAGGYSVIQFSKSAGGSSERLFIQNASGSNLMSFNGNGNVGIGTSDPNKKLTVAGGGINSAPVEINDAGNNAWGHLLVLRTRGDGGGQNGPLILFRNRDQKNWSIGGEDSGTAFQIREDAGDGSPEYGSGFGNVRFHVAAGGNVGIGTTNTQGLLTIHPKGNSNAIYMISDAQNEWAMGPNVGSGSGFGIYDYSNQKLKMKIYTDGDICIGRCN